MLLRAFSNNYDYTNSTANQEQVTPSIRPLSEFCDTAETNEEFAYNDSHLLHFDSFCEDRRGGEPGGKTWETDGRILLFEKFTNSLKEQYIPLLRISYAAFFPLKRNYIDAIMKTAHTVLCMF